MKTLKLWNGHSWNGEGHLYIAAYSKADACRMLVERYPHTTLNQWNREMNQYFSNCWGNTMESIVPERGVWQTKNLGGTSIEGEPNRIYPKYATSKKKEVKCGCMAYGPDENAACYENKHVIQYCPLHAAAPELLRALEHAQTRLNQVSTDYANTNFKLIRTTIEKAKGQSK